ncbi:DUF4183 domain-containing protein [Peribacillus sp. V2I11]|uniref:DUF4183 domain-containing protein n=1 Tax=Peribacillus sp. V2I11 TaxID=3042277 RepID=UPI00359419E1
MLSHEVRTRIPKRIIPYEFCAIPNGCQRIYEEKDGIPDIKSQVILDPSKASYMNLFINGVCSPKIITLLKKECLN